MLFGFKEIKGAIFDLDGTLIDSLGVWADIDRAFFLKRGMIVPEDYEKAICSLSFTQGAVYTKERFGLTESVGEIEQEWREMAVEEYACRIECIPGAIEFVKALKAKGILVALATASGEELYEPVLRRHGLYDYFDSFTTLKEVPRAKEFPDIYLLAAEKLRLKPEECIAFEDLPAGIASAKSCGMKTVWLCSPGGQEQVEQLCPQADRAITNFSGFYEDENFNR